MKFGSIKLLFQNKMTQDSTETDDTVGVEVIQEEVEEDMSEESSNQEEENVEEVFQEKIIIPSPKVSFDDNDIPIIVNSSASFEERVLEASPDATATLCLVPCDNCGRKFNEESLERHIKVNIIDTHNLPNYTIEFE